MTRPTRRLAVALTTAVLAVAATGCGGDATGGDADELVIGTIMPMSGPQQPLSNSYQSMKTYFDQLNDDGGIDGVTVKLVVQDDQFNPVNTPAAARTLVEQDGAQMLCANQGSGTFRAIAPYLAGKGIGAIPMSGESGLFGDDTTGFQLLTPYEQTAATLVRHAVEEMGLTKVAIVYTDDGIGLPFKSGAEEELDALGLDPVAEVKVNATSADQSAAAAKLKESGAEFVVFNHVASVVSQVVRATSRVGYAPQWGLTYAAQNKQVLELSGGALDDHAVFATPFRDYRAAELADYRAAMKEDQPKVDASDFLTVEGWVVGSVCADVIRRAVADADGVPTADDLRKALESTTLDDDLVQGLTWTADSRYGQKSMQVLAVKGGDFVLAADYAPSPDVTLGEQ